MAINAKLCNIFGIISIIAIIGLIIYWFYLKSKTTETFNKQSIPKTIHQIGIGMDTIPTSFKNTITKLKKKNHEYKYKFWSDKDIDEYLNKTCSKDIINAYYKINSKYGPARADLLRYIIIYNEGGVYLDLKSSTRIPLAKIIKPNDKYLITSWTNNRGPHENLLKTGYGEFPNWMIAAVPNHPFLKAVIDKCVENINNYNGNNYIKDRGKNRKLVGKFGVLYLTGPIAYTMAIKPLLKKHRHTFVPRLFNHRFIYTTVGEKGSYMKHEKIFSNETNKPHYTKLTEPIVI